MIISFIQLTGLKTVRLFFYALEKKKTIWNESSKNALKIKRNEIELYENQVNSDERNCIIIGPYLVEIKENGEIIKLREKIRSNGLNINFKEDV